MLDDGSDSNSRGVHVPSISHFPSHARPAVTRPADGTGFQPGQSDAYISHFKKFLEMRQKQPSLLFFEMLMTLAYLTDIFYSFRIFSGEVKSVILCFIIFGRFYVGSRWAVYLGWQRSYADKSFLEDGSDNRFTSSGTHRCWFSLWCWRCTYILLTVLFPKHPRRMKWVLSCNTSFCNVFMVVPGKTHFQSGTRSRLPRRPQ